MTQQALIQAMSEARATQSERSIGNHRRHAEQVYDSMRRGEIARRVEGREMREEIRQAMRGTWTTEGTVQS